MNAAARAVLADVQASPDSRNLRINRVGVKGLRTLLRIRQADGREQSTVARLDMSVGLPGEVKGTHMSRFVEIIEANPTALDLPALLALLQRMLARLGADRGEIAVACTYFIRKSAPVSGVESLLDHEILMRVAHDPHGGTRATLQVCVPVTSLCPCSKEISDYGAHNQRSHVTIEAQLNAPMTIEELVRIAEEEASCELFGLLKRPDEKFVTERAYENPKFAEDLVRDVAVRLNAEERITRYRVTAENFESIHNHSAFAEIEREARPADRPHLA
ncbi:MAG: GTP cyclohydrolase FolE2 [Steroidobacteraceae bacterium]